MGIFLGIAKLSNTFGVLKFLICFGVNSRCWAKANIYRKMRVPPGPQPAIV